MILKFACLHMKKNIIVHVLYVCCVGLQTDHDKRPDVKVLASIIEDCLTISDEVNVVSTSYDFCFAVVTCLAGLVLHHTNSLSVLASYLCYFSVCFIIGVHHSLFCFWVMKCGRPLQFESQKYIIYTLIDLNIK